MQPLMTVVLGSLTTTFTNLANGQVDSLFQRRVNQRTLDLIYIGIGVTVSTYVSTFCWIVSGENTIRRIRETYMQAILSQNMGFFDTTAPGRIEARLSSDMKVIQEGISEQVGIALSLLSTFITAIIVAFVKDWRLELVVYTILPAMVIFTSLTSRIIDCHMKELLDNGSIAKGLAADILSFPRIAQSFGPVDSLVEMYENTLAALRSPGYYSTFWTAIMLALISQGHKELLSGKVETGAVVNILFAVILAAFALGQRTRHIQVFTAATTAVREVFWTINKSTVEEEHYKKSTSLMTAKRRYWCVTCA